MKSSIKEKIMIVMIIIGIANLIMLALHKLGLI